MKDPNLKTKVIHSTSKDAWNVVAITLGDKYKIARIPYIVTETIIELNNREKRQALLHAEFISSCFNNSKEICELTADKN